MEKYIGNKTSLLPLIGDFIAERAPEASSISDLFAGTANVSRFFRARGFDVASGDVNRFTYVLARAYLANGKCPSFSRATAPIGSLAVERIRFEFHRSVRKSGNLFVSGQTNEQLWASLSPAAHALARLQEVGEKNKRPGIIVNNFTIWGNESTFRSMRGTVGQRNYFTRENALFLDGALNQLRKWKTSGEIDANSVFLLLASIIEEVVITANVNGTFHDFNRDRLWPNANQKFFLRLPLVALSAAKTEIIMGDALDAALAIPTHDVCYIDPPYNFRQYSAYYHFLNFIAAYPFLPDPKDYVSDLAFVRGQNMSDDYTSRFCFKSDFIDALATLISRVSSTHVVLSYYGGRNHWNHWSKVDCPTDQGLRELTALFRDKGLFDDCEIVPALSVRKNYQSRVGEQKGLVDEYLLLGSRSVRRRKKASALPSFQPNVAIGVAGDFDHFVAGGNKSVKDHSRLDLRGGPIATKDMVRVG